MNRFTIALMLGPSLAVADPFAFERLVGVDVVVIGEVHDNADHHVFQGEVIEAVQPAAVVFEMLGEDQATVANGTFATSDDLAEALAWRGSGWPEFELYRPIFWSLARYGWVAHPPFPAEEALWGAAGSSVPVPFAARVYGAEVSRTEARLVFESDVAAVFGEGADRFGLDLEVSPEAQAEREAGQLAAHCGALPAEILPGFVAAQRLRDARLAAAVLRALEDVGGPVVVITGNGHARTDWGVPFLLRGAAPDVAVVSIGQMEVERGAVPFDMWRITAGVVRDDPCAGFEN